MGASKLPLAKLARMIDQTAKTREIIHLFAIPSVVIVTDNFIRLDLMREEKQRIS